MKKILSLLLAVTLLLGVAVPGTLAIRAQADDGETPDPTKGMVINKTATAVDGDFEITLEAYATGTKVVTEVTKEVPTDIILVLDQSESMKNSFTTTAADSWQNIGERTNSQNYDYATNDENLWYKLEDGTYVKVTVTRTEKNASDSYTEFNNKLFSTTNLGLYIASNYYIFYYKDGNNYYPVTVTAEGEGIFEIECTYSYTNAAGETIEIKKSIFGGETPTLYTKTYNPNADYVYEYSYILNGEKQVIGEKSDGNGTTFGQEFYQKVTGTTTTTKLNALKNAVNQFAVAVQKKALGPDGQPGTEDDVKHRIAVVGFATGDYTQDSTNYPQYGNTELFIGATEYGSEPNDKGETESSKHYNEAFQAMNTTQGYENVIASKNALTAHGATRVDLGINMANGIFDANPIQNGEERNRIVIVFTDGSPSNWSDYSGDVANNAISKAYTTKNTYGATVYTVGIFDGANGRQVTDTNAWSRLTNENKFMHLVSSNFKTATSMSAGVNSNTYPANGASYYLSASDSGSLSNIFQQIASQIQSGGSSTTLDEDTVIKDIIAPQFQLPEGATSNNITLETYACTGKNHTTGEYTWSKNSDAKGATATVSGDTVSVTGFDFAENWVGQENNTYRGNKLVIKFKVQTKSGFLGGNDVYTNASAGVYENANATQPVMQFPKPTVNVPIGDVTVTAPDKNVYLLGSLTAEQIKSGATATCGDVTLTLDAENYGLAAWQTNYVNITVTYTSADGKEVTNLSDLNADTTYTVSVTVAPKTANPTSTQGTKAETKSNTATGNINVFTPELTFKDSYVWYGDYYESTAYSDNKTAEVWKHGNATSTDTGVNMIGEKPALTLSYDAGEGIQNNLIAVKTDIPVEVTVKIGTTDVTTNTTFQHNKCTTNETDPTEGEFWLHVNTCSLTIEKQAATGTTIGNDEYFVFKVAKDGAPYTEVTIQGTGSVTITGLPVGSYEVTEDSGIAWRYSSSFMPLGNSPELSEMVPSATVTCTNTIKNDKWLNDFQRIVNTYGDSKQPTTD